MRSRLSVLLLASSAACAHYSQQDGERLEAEVYALGARLEAIESRLERLETTQADHTQTLSELLADVGDLNLAARRNDADFGVQLEDIMQQLARLEGSTTLLDERVSSLESATTATKEELEVRLDNLADRKPPGETPAEPDRGDDALLDRPEPALAEAEKRIDRGSPESARRLLRELTLRNEKKRSFRKHQARAQFLIAESYFAEGSYQQAAAEYNAVRKSHPKAPQVPEAYFKLGLCFERLGLPADAKLFYQTLVKQFPRSDAATKARSRLKKL